MEADRVKAEAVWRVDVGGQKVTGHRRSSGDVVLTNWANLSKKAEYNTQCQLTPTNVHMHVLVKTAAESQAALRLSLLDRWNTVTWAESFADCLPLILYTLLTKEKRKKFRKHHGQRRPGVCFKYIDLTAFYKEGYFSSYSLWNSVADGPTALTKDERPKTGVKQPPWFTAQ